MKKIGDFLLKFVKLDKDHKLIKKSIYDSVLELSGVVLDEKQIVFKQGKIFLNKTGSAKNEIFYKKQEIEKNISEKISSYWSGKIEII